MLNSEENLENFEEHQEGGGMFSNLGSTLTNTFRTAKKSEPLPPLPPDLAPRETPSERRERLLREEKKKINIHLNVQSKQ